LRRLVRFVCFASVLAIFLFFGGASSPGSAEPARPEGPPTIEAAASPSSTSSNSSSGTITITMTGMVGDPGDISQMNWEGETKHAD